jgi:hypothetical protein
MILAAAVTADTLCICPSVCIYIFRTIRTAAGICFCRRHYQVLAVPLRGHWPYISITYEHTYHFYDKGIGLCLPLEVHIGTVAYELNTKHVF